MAAHAMRRRGLGSRVGCALLDMAAVGGTVCILLVPTAFLFHVTLIMFKTGSMSPAIPTGSLAVVRRVPASALHVGDVVTVDRSPLPPVTHRVTSISPAPGGARVITLRGDANSSDDPAPYTVMHVRLVEFSVPRLAYAVRALSSPLVLGVISVGAAGLVTWAFWPRYEPAPGAGSRVGRHAARRRQARAGLLSVTVLTATVTPVLGAAPPARAASTEDVLRGSVLTLTSVGDKAAMTHLVPGASVPWQIGVTAHPQRPGVVTIALTARGALTGRLQLSVRTCRVRWVRGSCPDGGALLRRTEPASAFTGDRAVLTSMPSDEQRWLLIEASLPPNLPSPPIGSATLVVTARGVGDTISAGGSVGPPAVSGTNVREPLLAGLFALAAGLAMTSVARVRLRRHRPDGTRR